MNVFDYTRRTGQGIFMCLALLLSFIRAEAQQCGIVVSPSVEPYPVRVDLGLSVPVTLNQTNIPGITTPSANCLPTPVYNFYQADGVTYIGNSVSLGCADVGTKRFYVSIGTGTNESRRVPLSVTVRDLIAPTTTYCPAGGSLTFMMDAGLCGHTLTAGDLLTAMPSFSDNCNLTITNSLNRPLAGYILPIGNTTVTFTATDPSGNTATCVVTYTVVDDLFPQITTCPTGPITRYVGTNCMASLTLSGTFTDNCPNGRDIYQVDGGAFQNDSPNNLPLGVGSHTVVVGHCDASNNTTLCAPVVVTVLDTLRPSITCPANVTVNANPTTCIYTHTGTTWNVTLSDNCTTVAPTSTFSYQNNPGQTPATYTTGTSLAGAVFPLVYGSNTGTTITWTAVDGQGNTKTCSFKVTVVDNTPPTITTTYAHTYNRVTNSTGCSATFTLERPNRALAVTPSGNYQPNFFSPVLNGDCTPEAQLEVKQGKVFGPNGQEITDFYNGVPALDILTAENRYFVHDYAVGTTILTYEFKDLGGNITRDTIRVTVMETIAPQIQCKTGTITVTSNDPEVIKAAALTTVSDNCALKSVTFTGVNGVNAFDCSRVNTTQTVTFTATDNFGNTASCNATVLISSASVLDTVAPAYATGQAAGTTILVSPTAVGGCTAVANWTEPTFTDNCNGPVILISRTHLPGVTPFNVGTTPVIYRVSDQAGNLKDHTFFVKVQDLQRPTARCESALIRDLPANGQVLKIAPSEFDNKTLPSNDNCGYLFASDTARYTCDSVGVRTYTLKIRDAVGNRDSCRSTVTIRDVTAPTAVCRSLGAVNLGADGKYTVRPAALNNNSSDNCRLRNLMVSADGTTFDTTAVFTCAQLGQRTIWLRATDQSGNSSSCSQTVVLRDVTAPTFVATTLPTDVTVECDQIPAVATPRATDNCASPVNVELITATTPANVTCNYTINRTWYAADGNGNSTSFTQVIRVLDRTAPVFASTLPTAYTFNTDDPRDCDAPASLTIPVSSITDNCSTNIASLQYTLTFPRTFPLRPTGTAPRNVATNAFTVPLDSLPIGTTTLLLTAADNCGNTSTRVMSLTMRDAQAPVFTSVLAQNYCGKTFNINSVPNNCSNTFSWQRPNVLNGYLEDCSVIPAASVRESFSTASVESSLNQINKFDYTNPSTFHQNVTAQFPVGSTVVSYTATDAVGNTGTCSFTVTIVDNQPPVIRCPAPQTLMTTCPDGVIPDFTNLSTVTDNCPNSINSQNLVFTQTPAAGTLLGNLPSLVIRNNATFTVKVKVSDSRNSDSCTVQVTLRDVAAPTPTLATLPVFESLCGRDTIVAPTANDGCNPANGGIIYGTPSVTATALNTTPPSYLLNVGDYSIVWTYNDGNGNSSTQTQQVRVRADNVAPIAQCVETPITVTLTETGIATLAVSQLNNGSRDACGEVSLGISKSQFSCADLGTQTVVLTVTDAAGNTATCARTITVSAPAGVGFTLTTSSTPSNGSDGTAKATVTGGSGIFSYIWSNGRSTAAISSLAVGTYTVTVTDAGNGCVRTASVTVVSQAEGIKITVGQATGLPGQTVKVPVSVALFKDIRAFSFTLKATTAAVGTITSISDLNTNLGGLQSNLVGSDMGIVWINPTPNGKLTLTDGTVLFNLNVKVGTAPVGSVTPVVVDGTPVAIDFQQDSSGVAVPRRVTTTNGSVTVGQSSNVVRIGGTITTWQNPENSASAARPVNGVTVTLSGASAAPVTTAADGKYEFSSVPANSNTITRASKVTAGNAGVTAGDLLRIVNHIFGDLMASPYQWVAADVNNDKKVNLADYLIIQRLSLGTDQHLQGSPDWKFVPKTFTFPANTATNGPLTNGVMDSLVHRPATQDYLTDDLIAVRMGDVNGNTPVSLTDNVVEPRGSGDVWNFRMEDKSIEAGQLVEIPVRATDFANRQAYQLTIGFDPRVMAYAGFAAGELPGLTEANFGTAHLGQGKLTTLWVSHAAVNLPENAVLFTLRFRATGSDKALSQVLYPSSDITANEALTAAGHTQRIDFEFVKPQGGESATFALYQNQPNPFQTGTVIGFRMPAAGKATLRVFDAMGRLALAHTAEYARGSQQIEIAKQDIGGTGIYWYEIETGGQVARRKMVITD